MRKMNLIPQLPAGRCPAVAIASEGGSLTWLGREPAGIQRRATAPHRRNSSSASPVPWRVSYRFRP
jgi:hypothetical protein